MQRGRIIAHTPAHKWDSAGTEESFTVSDTVRGSDARSALPHSLSAESWSGRSPAASTLWGGFFPRTMKFCLIVFRRHLQLQDIALLY